MKVKYCFSAQAVKFMASLISFLYSSIDVYSFFPVCVCVLFFSFQGRGDIQPQLDSAIQDVSDKYILLEETEKQALRKALIEERQRFCCFVAMLRPIVVSIAVGEKREMGLG